MRRISYAGETFVTTDGVADALLRLVAALGANHTAAAIEIPAFRERRRGSQSLDRRGGDARGSSAGAGAGAGGSGAASSGAASSAAADSGATGARARAPHIEIVRLVAGPASEMVSRYDDGGDGAVDAEFSAEAAEAVARLNARTEALGESRTIIHAHPHGKVEFDFDGLESL